MDVLCKKIRNLRNHKGIISERWTMRLNLQTFSGLDFHLRENTMSGNMNEVLTFVTTQ